MTSMRLADPTVTSASDPDPAPLAAAGLELERVVMLAPTASGLSVRKRTPSGRFDHSKRAGESAFLDSEAELDEFFAAIPAADDPPA